MRISPSAAALALSDSHSARSSSVISFVSLWPSFSVASTALLPLVPTTFLSSPYQASRMSSFFEERKKVRPSGFFLSAAISLN